MPRRRAMLGWLLVPACWGSVGAGQTEVLPPPTSRSTRARLQSSRIAAEKRVAGDDLSPLDRFQEKGLAGAARDAQKGAYRSEEIGAEFAT